MKTKSKLLQRAYAELNKEREDMKVEQIKVIITQIEACENTLTMLKNQLDEVAR
jgi:hypothetical protein